MSRDLDLKKLAKQLGVKPEALEVTYRGSRDEVMKKIKRDIKDARKAGYAVDSLRIEEAGDG